MSDSKQYFEKFLKVNGEFLYLEIFRPERIFQFCLSFTKTYSKDVLYDILLMMNVKNNNVAYWIYLSLIKWMIKLNIFPRYIDSLNEILKEQLILDIPSEEDMVSLSQQLNIPKNDFKLILTLEEYKSEYEFYPTTDIKNISRKKLLFEITDVETMNMLLSDTSKISEWIIDCRTINLTHLIKELSKYVKFIIVDSGNKLILNFLNDVKKTYSEHMNTYYSNTVKKAILYEDIKSLTSLAYRSLALYEYDIAERYFSQAAKLGCNDSKFELEKLYKYNMCFN